MRDDRLSVVADDGNRCGEAPLWDVARGRLVWTDIEGALLWQWRPGGSTTVIGRGLGVSGIALNADGDLVVGGAYGLQAWSGQDRYRPLVAQHGGQTLNVNDIVAGERGRLYAGTLYWNSDGMERRGALYLVTRGGIEVVDDGIELANGLAFSPDRRTLYFCDSAARRIYGYRVDDATGRLRDRRVVVQVPTDEGIPDGLAVDADGFLWCAQWYGAQVVRYDPDGRVERRVAMPVAQVSSLAFGGPDFDELFITTAGDAWRSALAPPGYDFATAATGGALYHLRPGVRGLPEMTADL
jgi:sugar lactone lactonase YvrE